MPNRLPNTMAFCLSYTICSKPTVGPEFIAEMPKRNNLKPKLSKKKTAMLKYKNGLSIYKKISRLPKLNLMKKDNRPSRKKTGGKLTKLKLQSHSLCSLLWPRNSWTSNDQ